MKTSAEKAEDTLRVLEMFFPSSPSSWSDNPSFANRFVATAESADDVVRRPLADAKALSSVATKAEKLTRAIAELPGSAAGVLNSHAGHVLGKPSAAHFADGLSAAARMARDYLGRKAAGPDPNATRRDHAAHAVAFLAARLFVHRRGELPSAGHDGDNEPTSDFGRLVQHLFWALAIQTEWKLPTQEAVERIRKSIAP